MNKVYFALALHFHQPIGNLEDIIERAYTNCYRPFWELLFKNPAIKMTFHISGCLLDYLEGHHPEIIELVKKMVLRGQVEMIGGAYYEPILTAINRRDLIGQLHMMSEYIEKRFGSAPIGMWIPERVWEPYLSDIIYDAGIRYSILDDIHFIRSAIKKEDMYGYFLTGEGSKKIAVFPSDKTLRYIIPFGPPEKTIDYLKAVPQGRKGLLFSYGDDGEKFGEWPGTHKWVFEGEWLKKFFKTLTDNRDWIELVTFSEYLRDNNPISSIHIDSSSYEEMMEWSGGSSWMDFLKKYPESNHMRNKMLYVSDKIDKIDRTFRGRAKEEIKEAKRELYKGQCNCAYWHGVFGGLYLYHLREAVYKHLIMADKITDAILNKGNRDWLEIKEIDLARNGSKEDAVIENRSFSVYIDPNKGGIITELDYKPLSFNLINTLSRREESYHKRILEIATKPGDEVKTIHDYIKPVSSSIKDRLSYDRFPRYCLREHFFKEDVKMDDFITSSWEEFGSFSSGSYIVRKRKRTVILEYESDVLNTRINISKEIGIRSEKGLDILYALKKRGKEEIDVSLGIEFNVTMPYLNAERYKYFCDGKTLTGLNNKGLVSDVSSFGISDSGKEFGIQFGFSKMPIEIWYFPIETVSQSELSYDLNCQGFCILPRWMPESDRGKTWDLEIQWSII